MFIAPTLAVTNTFDYHSQQQRPALDKSNWFWSDLQTASTSSGGCAKKSGGGGGGGAGLNRNRKIHDANGDLPAAMQNASDAANVAVAAKETVKKRLMAKIFQTLKELVVTNGANSPLAAAARRQRQQRSRRRRRAACQRRHASVTQLSSLSSGGSYFEPLLETIVEETDDEVLQSTQ